MCIKKHGEKCLTLMTWNIYFGADLAPLINTTPEQVPPAVTQVLNQFEQTDFPARARSLAKLIYRTQPDLIGLNEVALWTITSTTKKTIVNFLDILLRDLGMLDSAYHVVAVNKNFSNQLPSSTGDIVGLLDRDVILARCTSALAFSNIQENNFQTNLTVPIGNQPFTVLRGWSSADVCSCDKKFRLVNTHLGGDSEEVRKAQASELLKGPGSSALPLIFMGDFNSNAAGSEAPVYDMLMDAGFSDAWDIAGKGPGFTAFQARDLINPVSTLSQRIDLILFRDGGDGMKVRKIAVVGDRRRDKTPRGLWPSDHAGVAATLKFKAGLHGPGCYTITGTE